MIKIGLESMDKSPSSVQLEFDPISGIKGLKLSTERVSTPPTRSSVAKKASDNPFDELNEIAQRQNNGTFVLPPPSAEPRTLVGRRIQVYILNQ